MKVSFYEKISFRDILGIIIGSFIQATAIQGIIVHARLLTGGVSGIAIILKFLTGVDIWVWYVALNIPIFIAGYNFVSRRFVFYSLLGTACFSIFLALLRPINFGIDDLLLSAIFGGTLSGIGSGLVFRSKGSSGGTDIIAFIVRRYWGYNIGQTFFIINLMIIAASTLVNSVELALFAAISIFISSKVVDVVEAGPQVTRTAMIISNECDDITDAIIHNLHRGCTYMVGRGAYTGNAKQIIMVTVGKTQLPRLKEIVFHIDPEAFMTISETIEAYGHGFKDSLAEI
ncbi:YitT family protein [Syntrophomonas erecta]